MEGIYNGVVLNLVRNKIIVKVLFRVKGVFVVVVLVLRLVFWLVMGEMVDVVLIGIKVFVVKI